MKEDSGNEAVKIGNPKTVEFEVARTSLLPGIFKTCSANKDQPRPLKLFELSDVVLIDASSEVGARNERRVAALYSDKSSGFEIIHSLIDRIMQVRYGTVRYGRGAAARPTVHDTSAGDARVVQVLDIPWVEDSESDERKALGYVLKECQSQIFLEKRQAEILVKGKKVGRQAGRQAGSSSRAGKGDRHHRHHHCLCCCSCPGRRLWSRAPQSPLRFWHHIPSLSFGDEY